MLIFDCHLDLAWNALEWDRDLSLPVVEIRRREVASGRVGPGRGSNTVSFPALREGNVGVAVATLLARHDRVPPPFPDLPKSGFSTAEAAYASAVGQLAYYQAVDRRGLARILADLDALDAHVARWQAHLAAVAASQAGEAPPIGLILSMEGADPILAPDDLDEWWRGGLRIVGLAHFGQGRYSHGTGTPGPLNPEAPALLAAMTRLGMILDVTHLADEAMDQAMDLFEGPVLASHHNCRALVDRQRQLRDRDIRRISERGGVIGAALDAWMLDVDCQQGATRPLGHSATLASVADQIDHVCQVSGSARHAALGTDLDGGFGTEQSPTDLDTVADLGKIAAILRRRGYSKMDIEGIMHGNWLALVRRAWGAPSDD